MAGAPQLDRIRPENYQRAFSFKRLGYLLTEIVLSHYRKRDFLSIYVNDTLGTYIYNDAAESAGKRGKEIFADARNFDVFERGFRKNIEECRAYIKKVKDLTTASIGDFYDLRAMVDKTYYFFEKTEFFFTDFSYEGEMSETVKKNLFTLGDDLKMESRPLFVEMLTSSLYQLVDLVAKEHALEADDVRFYSFDEVIHLIETRKSVDPMTIAERKKSFVLYSEDERIIPLEGREKAEVIARFAKPDAANETEFKGTIANKGRVVAKARVILPELDQQYEDFVKKVQRMEFEKGEILVTETTSPDFVPLMKKAGGIIANQGGLNSHAAIMSRELKVPCLVGTYRATDILKTGDVIELDANTGIVRIVEKAQR